jgi:hypothetical protein
VLIVETPVFNRRVIQLISDEDYRELQRALVRDPELGDIIRQSGGLRKVRWRVLVAANAAAFAQSIIGRQPTKYC